MEAKRPPGYQQSLLTRLSVSHHFPEMAIIHCSTNEECWPTVVGWWPTTMTAQGEFVIWFTQSKNSSPSHIHWRGHTTHSPLRWPLMGALMVVVVAAAEEVVVVVLGPASKEKLHQWECATGSAARAVSAVDQQSPSTEATIIATTSSMAQSLLQALDIGARTTTWNGSCVSTTPTTTNLPPRLPFPPRPSP